MRTWSKYQDDIFRDVAEGTGHVVVLAYAGSGKTSTLVEALNHVPEGKSVLMVAFNKTIATELSARVPSHVTVMTTHSFGLRSMRKAYAPEVELDKCKRIIKEQLGVFDRRLRRDLIEVQNLVPKIVSLAKGSLASTEDDILNLLEEYDIELETVDSRVLLRYVLSTLRLCSEDTRHVDFDDMNWLPVHNNIGIKKYDIVFVDETQDLNACQVELALRACKPDGRIIAVGDKFQAIYGFRGADRRAIPKLIERLGARTLPLSVTYRCAKSIVEKAKQIVPDIEAAPGAEDGLVESVSYESMKQTVSPEDFILSRANAPLVKLCLSFLSEGRRATVQGRDIGASLLALIRKAGASTVVDLSAWIGEWRDLECRKLLARDPEAITDHITDKAECIYALMDGARTVDEVMERATHLFADSKEGFSRIILSSTHKAKGLERDRVYLLSWTYGRIRAEAKPSQVTEERNLYYVAITRAKKHLLLVRPPQRSGSDEEVA